MIRTMIAFLLGPLLSGCVIRHNAPLSVEMRYDISICADPIDAFFEPYTVKSGDTLWSIARKIRDRDTIEEIILRNKIPDPDRIFPGQIIYIQYPRVEQPKDAQQGVGSTDP